MDDTKLLFDRFDNLLSQLDLKGVEETIDDYISIIELWEEVDILDSDERIRSVSISNSSYSIDLDAFQKVKNNQINLVPGFADYQYFLRIMSFFSYFDTVKKVDINYERKIEVRNTTSDTEILMAISQVRESSRYDDVKVLINGRPIDQWVDTPYLLHYPSSTGIASLRIKISKYYEFSIKESRILKFNSFFSNHLG